MTNLFPAWRAFLSRSLIVAGFFLLTACVTSTERVFTADTSPEKALESRVSLAKQYLRAGDIEAAKRNLDIAMQIDSRASSVHEALAMVFVAEGEVELADKHFKRSIAGDSANSAARNNYAAFLYKQARYPEAMKQLEKVVGDELYEQRVMALGNMGLTALKLDDEVKAQSSFERVLMIDPRNATALLELAYISFDRGNVDESAAFYQQYRNSVRQQSSKALLLGIRLAEETIDNDARASYILALKNLYPESAEYKTYLAGDYE